MGSELRPRRSSAVALSRPVVACIVYMIHAFHLYCHILACIPRSSSPWLLSIFSYQRDCRRISHISRACLWVISLVHTIFPLDPAFKPLSLKTGTKMTIRRLEKLIGNLQHPSAFEEIEPYFLSRRYHLRKDEKESGWHLCLLGLSLRFTVL